MWHNHRPDNLTHTFDRYCAANPDEQATQDPDDRRVKVKRSEHLATFHKNFDSGFRDARADLQDMLHSNNTDSYWKGAVW